jgi:hypothetical protein
MVKKRPRRGRRLTDGLGVALMLVDLWRRLPPKRRKKLLALAARHGPTVARKAYRARRAAKRAGRS